MFRQGPVTTCIEELTLVVVSRENTGGEEPYRGHPPENDACHVFAQDASESPFLFDLRLRECLLDRSSSVPLGRAVLVCTAELSDRETLRRLRLVAARVKRGGCVTLAYDQSREVNSVHFDRRLRQLARFASRALQGNGVKVSVLPLAQMSEESAPLSAVWNRLQRQRRARQESVSSAKGASVATRSVTRTVVCQHRKVHSVQAQWPEVSASEKLSPFPALESAR